MGLSVVIAAVANKRPSKPYPDESMGLTMMTGNPGPGMPVIVAVLGQARLAHDHGSRTCDDFAIQRPSGQRRSWEHPRHRGQTFDS